MNAQIPPTCPFCFEDGTLMHMFLSCRSLISLNKYIQKLLDKIWPGIVLDERLFLFHALPSRNSISNQAKTLIDFILTLSKATIYRTYMNCMKTVSYNSPLYVIIFQKKLRSRIEQDHFIKCVDGTDEDTFNDFWEPIAKTQSGTITYQVQL
jgi:hypothetical protein